ncbi:MAG: bifunctional adenosylcobinamide kinase/adenosylcobinamide-phosphate guanylyltransferase [Desulfomonile tiedjei]|uniref:Adenosylcobinamide kinase n=1 Tax=Desulfomonile tiedjei TaxID=2358 RepID=A0A9D6V8L6_9BACT|nr:bifunctional adenosylcobinamide kinase/adenosylcobinamide-phosphate guanylyltransferase [Desulfomonile tiedjei]
MARIVLVTGGSRSGKSDYALETAQASPGKRAFVATCPVTDEEMARRIQKHRDQRSGLQWDTIEEKVKIAEILRNSSGFDVFLVDCLTLWVNNIMYEASQEGRDMTEEGIVTECEDLLRACSGFNGTVIFVTNEVGSGIVPENAAARLYRDLVGRCNQIMAKEADVVTLVVSGLPMNIKERNEI